MTLLEALLATVLVSVVAVACLEGTHGAAALLHRADATTQAVAAAEAALAEAALTGVMPDPSSARVTRVPYVRAGAGTELDRLDVEVQVPGAAPVRLTRLVARRTAGVPR